MLLFDILSTFFAQIPNLLSEKAEVLVILNYNQNIIFAFVIMAGFLSDRRAEASKVTSKNEYSHAQILRNINKVSAHLQLTPIWNAEMCLETIF